MPKKIKVVILSCIWKRPEITKVFLQGLDRLMGGCPDWVNVSAVLVHSNQDDYSLLKNHINVSPHSYHLVFNPNLPLGRKHNMGATFINDMVDFDYIMQLGSDNVVSNQIWKYYRPWMVAEKRFFGLTSLYLYHSGTGQFAKYSSLSQVFGAGRCIHSSIIKQLIKGSAVHLWTDHKNRGLDIDSEKNIAAEIGFGKVRVMPIKTELPLLVDIKSELNLNKWEELEKAGALPCAYSEHLSACRMFPELEEFHLGNTMDSVTIDELLSTAINEKQG